jgi:hypothetical protein
MPSDSGTNTIQAPPPSSPPLVPQVPSSSATASQATAKPVVSSPYLEHPQEQLPPVAKEEDGRYPEWLAHELAKLPPYKVAEIRKAIGEILHAQTCAATDEAFDEWLNQPGHEKVKAVYDDYVNPITVGFKLGRAPLDPIAAWLFDTDNDHLNAKSIVAALQGQSTLGDKLQDGDKRRLVDRALGNFSNVAVDKIEELAVIIRDPRIDPRVRRLVAERLLRHAVDPGDDVENPRALARAYVLDFLRAMRDDACGMAELVAQLPPQDGFRLAHVLGKQPLPDTRLPTSRREGSQDDLRFAEQDPRLSDAKLLSDARNQILAGLPTVAGTPAARSPAITALVYGLADEITPAEIIPDEISPGSLHRAPPLAHSLAVALADQWDPKNPPVERLEALLTSPSGASLLCTDSPDWKAAVREAVRLNPQLTVARLERHGGDPRRNPEFALEVATRLVVGVHGGQARAATPEEKAEAEPIARALQTRSGHKLLFDENVAKADRREALLIMLADHGQKLTRAAFEDTSDAWQLPAIAEAFAKKALATFNDGDFPSLSFVSKKNLIGFYLGIPPNTAGMHVTAKDITEAQQALARGEMPPCLTSNDLYQANDAVEKIAKKFVNTTGFGVEHAMLFSDGPAALPLFKGRKLDGTEFYVDQDGSVYEMTFPHDEKYRVHPVTAFQNFLDDNPLPEGTVYFQSQNFKTSPPGHRETPAARDTSKKVWHRTAQGATALAMIAALVGTDGLAGAALGYLGLFGAGYLAVDEKRHLAWLDAHGHDINPFTNPDQAIIASWFNMAANAAGPFAAAGSVAFRGLASALGTTAKVINFAALAPAFVEMARHPERVTASDLLQTAFFAWMALRHSPQRPATEMPRPLVTPTTPPPVLPPARIVPSAVKPIVVTPHYKLQGPVTPADKPVATTPMKLPNVYTNAKAAGTWSGTSPNAPLAVPAAPAELPANAGRRPPGGASAVAHADAAAQPGSSRSAAAKQKPAPVDPNTQHMAGGKGDKPKEPPKPSTPSKPGEATPPRPTGEDGKSDSNPPDRRTNPHVISRGGPGANPMVGQAPPLWATLADRVKQALGRLFNIESSHGALTDHGPVNFKGAAAEYRQALQEASEALRAHNAAGEKNLKALPRLGEPDPANPHAALPLQDLEEIFPDLAQLLHNLREPGDPWLSLNPRESFDHQAAYTSGMWNRFAQEAAKGKGITPELVSALIDANRSLVVFEKMVKGASPEVRSAWQDGIARARQIFDGYIAQICVERWLTAPALDNPAAVSRSGPAQGSRPAQKLWEELAEAFGVTNLRTTPPAPRTPRHPLTSYELASRAEEADQASRNLAIISSLDHSQKPYANAVADLSRALSDIHVTLDPLQDPSNPDPAKLSVPDSWNSNMKKWHDQLEKGVKELNDQTAILQGLIQIEKGKDVDVTRTFTPGASVKRLEQRLEYIQLVLTQVNRDLAKSSETAN